ncbi:MAG: formimidoylglutamase [Bacteroidales bacterium]|nr:formimidoylglutamase [Bacteroidales bacterium]
MDLSIYLQAVELIDFDIQGVVHERRMGDIISAYTNESGFPDYENAQLAIIGVNESRNAVNNEGCNAAPDEVRKFLYSLYSSDSKLNIVDLGNIAPGATVDDTYYALKTIVSELLQKEIVPIIIGGSQDLTYANYLAYENMGQIINITAIDSHFNLGNAEEVFNSRSYLSKIILHQPNYLFNYTNIGYQTYFVDQAAVSLMKNLFFDVYRLGEVRDDMLKVEPLVRNADLLSFDISSIKQSDAPANANASPNGFYGEEACQIARYAGLSDKLTSIGFYELNPKFDNNGQTAHLAAQMIWYFIEGYTQRKGDFPHKQKEKYIKYTVAIEVDHEHELVFYKSKNSGRWWMQVPLENPMSQSKYERHFMVPCSISDYHLASKGELPDRWWQVYQKLM